ncbi:MAG: YedE-related selenium metabolism membrane protein [Sporomusaceae bacterium]|jgi:YedE family putative selenium metabolism protein|nr:YedE-related selenium metabolism membrane protein [Sporomusaceae bacterium]
MTEKIKMALVGVLVAVVSLVLVLLGNPANMGFCAACFLRDIAGALSLHSAAAVQYARPEIMGIIMGATATSAFKGEFAAKGGSAPVTRFVLGFAAMIGALIFLGCPLRMVLRIGGGDLNAIVGLVGFAAGILGGVYFLNKGYTLKRTYDVSKSDGILFPLITLLLLGLLIFVPSVLAFSKSGPGAMHAPVWAALAAGLAMGAVGFLSRLCFVAGIRDFSLFRNSAMLIAFVAIIAAVMAGNLGLGSFKLAFDGQPIAHTDGLWNFLGMLLVGLCSVLLGGCPFRQMVLAGSGNSDSVISVLGMVAGAAFAHNFNMASSAAGVTANGKIGFAVAFLLVIIIAVYNTCNKREAGAKA